MTPLDTYSKNRHSYGVALRGGDDVFAYPRMRFNLCPRTPYYRRWWNLQMFYRRTYRETAYDFKNRKPSLR